jgi:ribosomal protein S28E/S33
VRADGERGEQPDALAIAVAGGGVEGGGYSPYRVWSLENRDASRVAFMHCRRAGRVGDILKFLNSGPVAVEVTMRVVADFSGVDGARCATKSSLRSE